MVQSGSVAVPVPISSVPTAALREAAQRRAASARSADAVADDPLHRRLPVEQPTVNGEPPSTSQQVPTQAAATAAARSDAHNVDGYAAMPNGEARSATAPTLPHPNAEIGAEAISSSAFESWLDATLPTSQHDAVMSGPRSLRPDPGVVGAASAPEATHRWTISGGADAGCARAARVKLLPSIERSEPSFAQAPAATHAPHAMPDWFMPTQ